MTSKAEIQEFAELLAENLSTGNLDQVISLFQYNGTLYETIGLLVKSEKMNVRIGITAVMEELLEAGLVNKKKAIENIQPLLKDQNPVVRGDAANLVGILGDMEHISLLEPLLKDENFQVVEVVEEAIEEIKEK
ncbi:MAG: HEAT repeat domain-containing protein [Deltaproteobacteria bacterium]|jgi:HEAT repeat protein|nr:HEAT repeat domain-containing protein [Deltaproteobacteria bacterium]